MSGTGGLMGPAQLRPRGSFSLIDIAGARAAASKPVSGSANPGNLVQATSIAIDPDLKLGLRASPDCVPLAAGHHRRIYFGDPTPGVDGFGLGYVEIDDKGREIAATRKPITSFDPTTTTVCVPLGAQGAAVKETWELINLTSEDHNFHIHQTRFRLLQGGNLPGTTLPTTTADGLGTARQRAPATGGQHRLMRWLGRRLLQRSLQADDGDCGNPVPRDRRLRLPLPHSRA